MKIGVITQTNTKGQIVIPKKMRDELGITVGSHLHLLVQDNGIYMRPVNDVVHRGESAQDYYAALKKTQGSWAGDDWKATETKRSKIELSAAKKAKQASW